MAKLKVKGGKELYFTSSVGGTAESHGKGSAHRGEENRGTDTKSGRGRQFGRMRLAGAAP